MPKTIIAPTLKPKISILDDPNVNPKTLIGSTKIPLSVIPATALLHLGMAMENGEYKYNRYNWREKKVPASIYLDAAQRHLLAWQDGEELADDSLVHHLGHAMACCAIVLDAIATDNLIDDRGPPGVASKVMRELSERFAEIKRRRKETK